MGVDLQDSPGKDRRKDKVRSVWISFVGRIVAQIIGAVASVVLGIMVLQRFQSSSAPPPEPTAAATATRTRANRRSRCYRSITFRPIPLTRTLRRA